MPVPKIEWSFLDLLLEPEFTAVMVILLSGIVISLFYRFGATLQVFGLLGFVMTAQPYFHSPTLSIWSEFYIGPGYFVALVGVFVSVLGSKNFWWQRSMHPVVPTISRVIALSPNATRAPRLAR